MKNKHVGALVLSEKQVQDGVKIVANKLNAQFHDAVIISVVPGGGFYLRQIWCVS